MPQMQDRLQDPCQFEKTAQFQAFAVMNENFRAGEYSTVGEISQLSGSHFGVTAGPCPL
jgi:hypothetical protein